MSTEASKQNLQELLNTITQEQTFSLELSDQRVVSCKQLTTAQLRELIKTVVDSPITQAAFNSTVTKVFKQSSPEISLDTTNTLDRILFIIETRIKSLSPTMKIENKDKTVEVNFTEIKAKLLEKIKNDKETFLEKNATNDKITLKYGMPLLKTEQQLNDELYKDFDFNVENQDELRKVIGDAFINEIAKTIKSVTIQDTSFDLNEQSFKARIKIVESLPASTIQEVIDYIERYKAAIEDIFNVEGVAVPLDGSIFSLR
jgi:uncharacterized UPF0160 family protein